MNAFIKTLIYGSAALGIFLITMLIAGLVVLKKEGWTDPNKWREAWLKPEEKAYLAKMNDREPEPAPASTGVALNEDDLLERIAEMANADRASQLVAELRKQKQSLTEREALIDQQWAELQLSKADLVRMKAQLDAQKQEIDKKQKQLDYDKEQWAQAQLKDKAHVNAIGMIEKKRYEEQAKLYEQMKDSAWASLRRFKPSEIAIYLTYIAKSNPKMAAKIMTAAQNDAEIPDIGLSIQREMLLVDLEGTTGSQFERLANLYDLMPPDAVVTALRDSSPKDIASILFAMEKNDPTGKKRSAIQTALQKDNSQREMEVQRYLKEMGPSTAGASQ